MVQVFQQFQFAWTNYELRFIQVSETKIEKIKQIKQDFLKNMKRR